MKIFKMNKTKLGLALITFLSSAAAFAAGETNSGADLSSLTNSINFDSVLVGIMAVASSIIVLYAGFAGVRWILRMVKGA
ncbi:TPA: major capsid protein [Providencia stuartii]|uniref:Phage-related membrane protein n=1 Tax=Providencia stuartii (strain MRSN 2154) TaxID=1157951 RepID=A0A140NFN4_PROSM|nr:major capsid protein [Providencia stuartii]AFH91915.1 phage-related membrane protein [Providencia stuartii MRSN 2154]WRV50058.1 major capsid protein [Providencia stuartii]